jgi:hypothetical protein
MTLGGESNVIQRFAAAGATQRRSPFCGTPSRSTSTARPTAFVEEFRKYYGPTMNAFEAAEKNGRASDPRNPSDSVSRNGGECRFVAI